MGSEQKSALRPGLPAMVFGRPVVPEVNIRMQVSWEGFRFRI